MNVIIDIGVHAEQQFKKEGINIIHNARAIEVTPNEIVVLDKVNNQNINIPCGMPYFNYHMFYVYIKVIL